jgi:trans-aconitate methyltransferase
MNLKEQTIDTYSRSAKALAEKFDSQAPRTEDIEYVFSFCAKENPHVLEIGCGSGRDAQEICKHTNNYEGLDISKELLEYAQKKLPHQTFVLADIENFAFPADIDIVFAFASLIHVPKESFTSIMEKLFNSINEGGLLFISLKHSTEYQEVTKTDEFGTRTYWHYAQSDIQEIAPQFSLLHTTIQDVRGQIWIDVLLQKK